jgi:hypothetical protein
MNLTVKALIRKFISYLAIYTLLIISFMLFVTVSGYYLFIFDWRQKSRESQCMDFMHWT